MSLIGFLRQANSYFSANDFRTAKECMEKALDFCEDEQTRSIIYEQLSVCCIHLNESENAIIYLELLTANGDYDGIDDAYVNLARLYGDNGRFDDMYRIAKKINVRPSQPNRIKQPEQLFYELWCKQNEPNEVEHKRQRSHRFEYSPKISIAVPVYNVEIRFLIEMLDSVCSQTYGNWELCLADGSSSCEEIRETIRKYAEKDSRIKYIFLEENLGISENTNTAIMMSDGDYIAFLDHDDVLAENALFEIVMALETDRELEFIYSDHDYIVRLETGYIRMMPVFKPAWSPILFEQQNYIVHLVTIKRELVLKVGLFHKEYDGWQDTDLIFKITESTNKTYNIPKVLYHWRRHTGSVGVGIDYDDSATSESIMSMRLRHLSAINVLRDTDCDYTLRISIRGNPKVSVIIINRGNLPYLKKCIESIYLKAGYNNYEIIIVDKGSIEQDVLNYYKYLKQNNIAKVISKNVPDEYCSDNYASDYNLAVKYAVGDYLVFISGVCEMLNNDWMYIFLLTQQYPNTGLTGCAVNYLDDKGELMYASGVQLTGSNCGVDYIYGCKRKRIILCPEDYIHKEAKLPYRNATATDQVCVMIKKELFERFDGFDICFPHTFFVYDLCLKFREAMKYNVWINAIEVNCTQKKDIYYEEAIKKFNDELRLFKEKYRNELDKEDPFMTVNFSVDNYESNNCYFNIDGGGGK